MSSCPEKSPSTKVLRWSCCTRGGTDFVYRRIVSYVRRSLTVVLCLTDGEVSSLCGALPTLSSCPTIRLESWSLLSMRSIAARKLAPSPPISPAGSSVDRDRGTGAVSTNDSGVAVRFWEGSTHANLVGLLAFGRFQSTVAAAKNVSTATPTDLGAATVDGAGSLAEDAKMVAIEAERLYKTWIALAEPSCVAAYHAVERASGGGGGGGDRGGIAVDNAHERVQKVLESCFRNVAEEGCGPRRASLQEVLCLYKHLCRLGCTR